MFLYDKEISELSGNVIENFDPDNFGNISYDLRIEEIIKCSKDGKNVQSYMMEPGETVFVSSVENIKLPNDCLGIIIQRNSCIRMGLDVVGPVYQPGHYTKVFVRVTNQSQGKILLKQSKSIASIMFYRLNEEVNSPYQGIFVNEFDFKGVGKFHTTHIPEIIEINEKVESIKDIERNLYSGIITLMTIFIGIFSLVNLNINLIEDSLILKNILVYNFIFLGGISTLVTLISLVIPKTYSNRYTQIWISSISVAMFVVALAIFVFL